MASDYKSLFSDGFLRAEFSHDYLEFRGSPEEQALVTRLRDWSEREMQNETTAQGAFVDRFFKQLWGYTAAGERPVEDGYTCYPQFAIQSAGASGGTGSADLALGIFGIAELPATPQVICEFKDIRSALDTPQRRKNDTRTPVKQCGDYLRELMAVLYGHEPIQPHWGIVTDMNEFRLYRRTTMPTEYQRFVIHPRRGDASVSLLAEGDGASFQRFLFATIFKAEQLISRGGDPPLASLLKREIVRERQIEKKFYGEYRVYRERLIRELTNWNPLFAERRGRLVRLAQTILDRCIFVLFCEDMGRSLSFPPSLLRDILIEFSTASYYEPDGEEIWARLRRLFDVMNRGGRFQDHEINRFNGGLFAMDQELDSLRVPNRVFCERNQGSSSEIIRSFPETLLYFSASYNFGVSGDGDRAISLYTLGHIFEQSITELEALEAEAENKPSLTKITKRKRDGVYYTPEKVVVRIVEETLGPRLADVRRQAGWDENVIITERDISRQSPIVRRQVSAIDRYSALLDRIKVVDPACGSGAFLIRALEFLLSERRRVAEEREKFSGLPQLFDQEQEIRRILSLNIYGVDINPASIEIARLALWLHTARADRPLCDLDHNVQPGNSLISPAAFRAWDDQMELLPEEDEVVHRFDWRETFPEVFEQGGFDCVVGNPPYVKLQHFRRVAPEVAGFLREARDVNGSPIYRSTQGGNFDLFLPFIEKGISLLNDAGRMGFIAPSLWMLNQYGSSLRRLLHEGGCLDRWLDFKSYQIFEEATTYTSLQFFTRTRNEGVRFAFASDGALIADWSDPAWMVRYEELPESDPWVLLPEGERRFVQRLSRECRKLGELTDIIVGIQTSADHIYHMKRICPGRYESRADRENPIEVEIEDAIMRPLISSVQTDRYVQPQTDLYLLFPYDVSDRGAALVSSVEMRQRFPNVWAYLKEHEVELRARESNGFDDEQWYRFGRNQNVNKQHLPKLVIPRLVTELFCAVDSSGYICLDNVDVGGILSGDEDPFYMAAILNSPVANFVWRRISKPFQNDYRSANKQFIAPLPIPPASDDEKAEIARRGQELERLHTQQHHLEEQIERRLEICEKEKRAEDWVLPLVGSPNFWKRKAPRDLTPSAKTKWAKAARQLKLTEELNRLQTRLRPDAVLAASHQDGELRVDVDGARSIEQVYVEENEAGFLLVQWRRALRQAAGKRWDAAKLVDELRTVRIGGNTPLRQQTIEFSNELRDLLVVLNEREAEMNEQIFALYRLTADERSMVVDGRS